MAEFCLALRIAPSEYKKLTLLELNQLAEVFTKNKGSTDIVEELMNGW